MKTTITNKDLKRKLDVNEVLVQAGNVSLFVDTPEFYIDTTFSHIDNEFKVSAYLGDTEIEFTETQKDMICNLLGNAENKENEFSYDNQFHALSLTF